MNSYKAFYKNKTADIRAETSLSAQIKAANHFKAKKPWDVSVVLVRKHGGEMVITSTVH